ncbi:hypothetical protein M0R45_024866 [Rubus argutus]|uniref:Uncharacterized protein n=1 Tax=Rubus argutus TaxID=59490 RepID=A0AAW1WUA5_RUBAR
MDYSDDSGSDSSSESSSAIPVTSTGIVMLSVPDSSDEDGDNDDNKNTADQDIFETPPEYALVGTSQEKTPLLDLDQIDDDDRDYEEEVGDVGYGSGIIVAVGGCGAEGDAAVDLGRDADPVFSEPESVEFRVSKRNLSPDGSLAESSPSKKLRVSKHDLGNSDEELETERISLSNHSSSSDQTLEIAGDDTKSAEESLGKKNLEYSGSESVNATEGTQPVTEESDGPSSVEYSSEDSSEIVSTDWQPLRVLPLSFCPQEDSSVMQAEGRKWSDLLDLLKLLKEISGEDYNGVDNCSFLEIAKRRGMTFPRL